MHHIAIIEDHPRVREHIQRYLQLQDDCICDLAFESMEHFFKTVSASDTPEIALVDLGLPGMSGIEGIRLIKERFPAIEMIVLTNDGNPDSVFAALCAGASGYLLKDTPLPKLKEAIDTLHAGGSPMSPTIARKITEYFNRQTHSVKLPPKASAGKTTLTRREKEIVAALVDGLSYKMVAGRLNIAIDTVRGHIKRIYTKLHVHSKAEVIRKSLSGEI